MQLYSHFTNGQNSSIYNIQKNPIQLPKETIFS